MFVAVSHLTSTTRGDPTTDTNTSEAPSEVLPVELTTVFCHVYIAVGDPNLALVPAATLCGKNVSNPVALVAVTCALPCRT